MGQELGDKTVSPTFQSRGWQRIDSGFRVGWKPGSPMPRTWGLGYRVKVLR